jgi:hypothetical protein
MSTPPGRGRQVQVVEEHADRHQQYGLGDRADQHLDELADEVRDAWHRRAEQTLEHAERHVEPAHLATGQSADPGPRLVAEPDQVEELPRPARPGVERGEMPHHLQHRELGPGAAELQDDADPGAPGPAAASGIHAEHRHRASVPAAEPFEDLHCRGLAGAVGPEQREDFSGADLQVDAVDRGELPVALAQPARLDRRA